jgi:hypothetical protein
MGVDGDLRHTLGFARRVDWLTNHQPPAQQARVLAGGDDVAFDAG